MEHKKRQKEKEKKELKEWEKLSLVQSSGNQIDDEEEKEVEDSFNQEKSLKRAKVEDELQNINSGKKEREEESPQALESLKTHFKTNDKPILDHENIRSILEKKLNNSKQNVNNNKEQKIDPPLPTIVIHKSEDQNTEQDSINVIGFN